MSRSVAKSRDAHVKPEGGHRATNSTWKSVGIVVLIAGLVLVSPLATTAGDVFSVEGARGDGTVVPAVVPGWSPVLSDNSPPQKGTGTSHVDVLDSRKRVGLGASPLLRRTDKDRVAGSECPADYLCGQNLDHSEENAYYYSDLGLCNPDDPNQCGRITAEDFPPPSGWTFGAALGIGEITFYGTYNGVNGNTKAHEFAITFYPFDPADPNRPLLTSPECSYPAVIPYRVTQVYTIVWPGGGTSDGLEFAVKLPTACAMYRGYFSIASSNVVPGIYWLWAGASATEGSARTSRWWANAPASWTPLPESNQDRQYCFGRGDFGACCYDATAMVNCQLTEADCLASGGRFAASCWDLNPQCGSALGACCHEDGTCTYATYGGCIGEGACCLGATCRFYSEAACLARAGTYRGDGTSCTPNPCFIPYCTGDANCDYVISYADINPFVRAITSESRWKTSFSGSNPPNGCTYLGVCDINGSGAVDYGDVNPFVNRLWSPGPCPAKSDTPDKLEDNQWLGPATPCSSCGKR